MTHENKLPLTLSVITSEKTFPTVSCDTVNLNVKDDEKGKKGGSYGIKTGHASALMATSEGTVTAKADGNTIFSIDLSEGFACIDKNHITITANLL